ncbi:hypothetical protein [Salinigranum rubrum]|uniref:hypothetical protein n=1 Tax=Salinigranum rubrum TaxID=755307 RepID=UPI0013A54C4F|nr:hypothetical protein [Salinigranum rubrum]
MSQEDGERPSAELDGRPLDEAVDVVVAREGGVTLPRYDVRSRTSPTRTAS